MNFERGVWLPVAVVISVINVAGAGYAAIMAEPLHAAAHVVLALVFGAWAVQLGQRRGPDPVRAVESDPRLELLDAELTTLQRELTQARDRLEFTERLLEKRPVQRDR